VCHAAERRLALLLAIGLAIIILWLLGNLAFHLTVGLIHILPIIGLVLILMHFLRRKGPAS
jgi:hypothetical protein